MALNKRLHELEKRWPVYSYQSVIAEARQLAVELGVDPDAAAAAARAVLDDLRAGRRTLADFEREAEGEAGKG